MSSILYYAHDPMCSWCWAFRPTWDRVYQALPDDIELVRLLGGLAPDTDQPMPHPQRKVLQDIWHNIEAHVPGTRFNFSFWEECQPRRSTYPACRAVIAATEQSARSHEDMTRAIQHAYYLHARNPSDNNTLVALAEDLGLDVNHFVQQLNAPATQRELQRQIELCYRLGIPGFPSLVLYNDEVGNRVPIEFNNPELQVQLILDAERSTKIKG